MPVRVFLISDHRLLLLALAAMVESRQPRFMLAGSSGCLAQAIEMVGKSAADVVLLDIDIDGDGVLGLISALHAASGPKILLFTRLADQTLQDKAILLGAQGVVDRDASPELLFNALQKVNDGQFWLNRETTGRIIDLSRLGRRQPADPIAAKVAQLTERERRIVAFIARSDGESGKVIAKQLCIGESTLRNHLSVIYSKLGVANRHGLLAYAFQNGLAERLGRQNTDRSAARS